MLCHPNPASNQHPYTCQVDQPVCLPDCTKYRHMHTNSHTTSQAITQTHRPKHRPTHTPPSQAGPPSSMAGGRPCHSPGCSQGSSTALSAGYGSQRYTWGRPAHQAQHSTPQHSTAQCREYRNTIVHDTTRHSDMTQHGIAQHGTAQYVGAYVQDRGYTPRGPPYMMRCAFEIFRKRFKRHAARSQLAHATHPHLLSP